MVKDKWREVFDVIPYNRKDGKKGILGRLLGREMKYGWAVVDKRTTEILGVYEDRVYAVKQARYKYKRLMNKIDKILLR